MRDERATSHERYRSAVVSYPLTGRLGEHRRETGRAAISVRVRPVAPQSTVALMTFSGAHEAHNELPARAYLEALLGRLADDGFTSVRTSALSPASARHLGALGFGEVQHLELLAVETKDVRCSRPPDDLGITRLGRVRSPRRHLARLARLDRDAFGDEWSLDADGLADALDATHHSALFVAGDRPEEGFAVAGVTDDTGYLQRLAVSTVRRRVGVGSALLSASVAWMRGRGCERVLVNTESDNVAALALYTKFGFRPLDHPLSVMERSITDADRRLPR